MRAFAELETERDQIKTKLAGLATQAGEHGGDRALLDALSMLGDVLDKLPNKVKAQLFDALDLAVLYSKTPNQITCRAVITTATPAALAAIIATSETPDLTGLLTSHPEISDLAHQRRGTVIP